MAIRIKRKTPELLRAPGFGQRFREACDESSSIPEMHDGRYSHIVAEFEKLAGDVITTETVRKWHHGVAAPRPDKIETLSRVLGVDPVWLQTGHGTASGSSSGSGHHTRMSSDINQLNGEWDGVVRVPIRQNLVVEIGNVPLDLAKSEAQKIANVILAHAS